MSQRIKDSTEQHHCEAAFLFSGAAMATPASASIVTTTAFIVICQDLPNEILIVQNSAAEKVQLRRWNTFVNDHQKLCTNVRKCVYFWMWWNRTCRVVLTNDIRVHDNIHFRYLLIEWDLFNRSTKKYNLWTFRSPNYHFYLKIHT